MSATAIGGAADLGAVRRASWTGWMLSAAIYALFAVIVFVVHGNEPPLVIDHVAYLRQADDLIRLHPDGAYWKSITQIHSYGVLLAYLHAFTGSHIASLKLALAAMTITSLLAFELLISLYSSAKWESVLFTLISGLFVTFGASFWGYTDFAASLQRTAMVPIALIAVWFWLSRDDRPIKFVVFPLLVASSVVHLSAYYVAAILGIVELWDWAARRQFRLDARFGWLVVSLIAAQAVRVGLEYAGLAFTADLWGLVVPSHGPKLDPATAWQVELMAFPWRNMPLPLTSVTTIAASYIGILMVAIAGVAAALRRGLTAADRLMLAFAGATIAFSYGPQTLLWAARQFLPIYPFGLEETRAINLIMIPSLYFAVRLFDVLWRESGRARTRLFAAGAVALLILQPILLLHLAPERLKEDVLEHAVSTGLIRHEDSLRLLYARQLLGLHDNGARFYYSSRGVLSWLQEHAPRGARVLSTLNELLLVDVEAVGPFNGLLGKPIAAPERKQWADSVVEVDRAITSRDLTQVEAVARKYGAEFAIVPWPARGAVYRDDHYSIARVGA